MFGEDYSESPRLPSPWEAAVTSGHLAPGTNATASGSRSQNNILRTSGPQEDLSGQHHVLRCLIPEEDLSGHIEYKLRLPAFPSIDRLARLTSQLKWRLLEGGGVGEAIQALKLGRLAFCGHCDVIIAYRVMPVSTLASRSADIVRTVLQEAIYELGVCDNGLLLGIDREEMDASLRTLEKMAEALGAHVKITREVQVDLSVGSTTTTSHANGVVAGDSASSIAAAETRLQSWKVNAILNKEAKDKQKLRMAAAAADDAEADHEPNAQGNAKDAPSKPPFALDGREYTISGKPKALTRKARRSFRRENGFPVKTGVQLASSSAYGADASHQLATRSSSSSPVQTISISRSMYRAENDGNDLFPDTSASPSNDDESGLFGLTAENQPGEEIQEEERLRIRRRLRKQWKKERHVAKRQEASTSWNGSPSTSSWQSSVDLPAQSIAHKGKYSNIPLPAWPTSSTIVSGTPEDRFMDALVSIFDGVTLEPLTPDEEALYRTFGGKGGKGGKKKKKKWRHRYNYMKKVAEMAGTPIEDSNGESNVVGGGTASAGQQDISWYSAPRTGEEVDVEEELGSTAGQGQAQTIPFSVPLPNTAASKNGNGHGVAALRFAVECLVFFPEDEAEFSDTEESGEADQLGPIEEDEQDEDEEEEDPLFGSAFSDKKPKKRSRERLKSSTGQEGGARRPSAGSKNSFMRSHYIDFENPDLILP